MEREAKLRRLNAFRRKLPHVTASALAAVLVAVQLNGVPDIHDRTGLREARDFQSYAHTPFGPIMQTIDVILKTDVSKQLPVANPFAMLWTAVSECGPFSAFLKKRLLQSPPSVEQPWRIVLYSDEVTPGNPLSTANRRKFHAVYWSFLELGPNALSHEQAWFCVMTEYSHVINQLHAGLSQVFSAILKAFFDESGFDFSTTGINLPFDSGDIRLWAKMGAVIQDGGAHKSVWSSRGDGASKYCLLCKNLFTSSSRITDQSGVSLLISDVIKLADLVPSTDVELRNNARYLESQAATMAPGLFEELQQSMGLTYHKKALLLDRSLDRVMHPTEVYMHDWMHALYVDGIVNLCVYLLFEAFIDMGMTNIYQIFEDYAAKWQWPRRIHGAHLPAIFSASRRDKHRSAKHIKCQASDLLSLTPVLALFVQQVLLSLHTDCDHQCLAFLALADIVDIIVSTSRNDVPPEQLLARVHLFLEEFVKAFGYEMQVPKFHWLLHLAEILGRLGFLLNCFVLERKHRIAKRYATDLYNTSKHASTSLLGEVVSHQLGQLDEPEAFNFEVGLVNGRKAPARLRQFLLQALEAAPDDDYLVETAVESRMTRFGTCCKGDVVLVKEGESFRAAKVELHCAVGGVALSFLNPWKLVSHEATCGYAVWDPSDTAELFETADIIDTVTYRVLPNGSIGTILPIDYR